MINNTYSYTYYSPSKILVGVNVNKTFKVDDIDMNCNPGIVVCQYKCDKWTNDLCFERISGYKRTKYRDATKNILKDINGSAIEYDNVPTSGFKIVNGFFYDYRESGNTPHYYPIIDPRGFVIGLSRKDFIDLISSVTMVDGEIKDKLVYCWKQKVYQYNYVDKETIKYPFLISEKTNHYKTIKKYSENLEKSKTGVAKKFNSKKLTPGKVYTILNSKSSTGKSQYLYVGKIKKIKQTFLKEIYSHNYLCKESEYYAELKNIGNPYDRKPKNGGYSWSYRCGSLPWKNSRWDFVYEKYQKFDSKLNIDENVFINLEQLKQFSTSTKKNFISFFNSLKNKTELNIRDIVIFNSYLETNIQLKNIIEESDYEDNSIDFKDIIVLTDLMTVCIKRGLEIAFRNFPPKSLFYETKDLSDSEYTKKQVDWEHTEFEENPLAIKTEENYY